MKVILENFGPIKRVEFDLSKDLNVIFGKNNIGKSYAITALYIILKHLINEFQGSPMRVMQKLYSRRGFSPFDFQEVEDKPSVLSEIVKEIRNAFRKDINLQEYDLSSLLSPAFQTIFASALQGLLTNSFNTSFQAIEQLSSRFSSENFIITIESSQLSLVFSSNDNDIILKQVNFRHSVVAKRSKINLKTVNNEHRTILYFKSSGGRRIGHSGMIIGNDEQTVLSAIQLAISGFRQELLRVTQAIYFLPASRSGLYQALSTFGALFAELSKSRNFVTKGVSIPNISEPVADYFLNLSTINPVAEDSEAAIIAGLIERDVLGGEVSFDEQTKKLFFKQSSIGLQMDLSFASSMISEIAPIVAHFKYILRLEVEPIFISNIKGDFATGRSKTMIPSLIFIEEPEAHLHPEVQVKIMEFFARLTKHNVKVVMTSHSNYMFNKLSNLLLTNALVPEKVGSYLMRTTPEGSVMDSVAMRAEEVGIVDENFVDVAEQLYNERLEAYDKLNAKQ